jgi:CrcB protein
MTGLRTILIVGSGGFVGSAARHVLATWVHTNWSKVAFPIGTLTVNGAGCLLIGLLAGVLEHRPDPAPGIRLFLMIGVLGGFTTFSSFAYETLGLARDAQLLRALANVAAQVVVGLAAAGLGWLVARP